MINLIYVYVGSLPATIGYFNQYKLVESAGVEPARYAIVIVIRMSADFTPQI